jgi:hypothetical protein
MITTDDEGEVRIVQRCHKFSFTFANFSEQNEE